MAHGTEYGDALAIDQDEDVRVITLNRPERLNAFTPSSYRAFAAALGEAAGDEQTGAVLVVGAGRAFCSGVDLVELATTAPSEVAGAFDELIGELLDFPKPLVAGVHGSAVGFGATLLLHCDVVIVADDARLRLPFTELGTVPEAGSSWLLAQAIGGQRASELLLTARWITGTEAVTLGIASRATESGSVRAEAMELAHRAAALPRAATAATKSLIRHGRADAVRAAMQREHEAGGRLGPLHWNRP